MRFDFDSETRRRLGYRLIDQVDSFFSSLPDRPVQLPLEQRSYGPLHHPLPENGEDAEKVLNELFREMVEQGFHVPSANYFGLMNPTPTYMGVLGEALVAGLNPQLATLARSQLASKIELETVRWIGERVGWAGEFNGTFTSGGNEANFSGLALALAAKFPDAVEEGVASIGGQPVCYASAESHHSLDKSAGLLGIGRKALRRIAVNRAAQLDPQELGRAIAQDRSAGRKPFCVVATAGTTNSGAVDDLIAISEVCREQELWLHVDGAYGGVAIFSNQHRGLVRGIERADSLTIDLPARDIRKLLNKVMKKNGKWEPALLETVLRAYQQANPLTADEWAVLKLDLTFPHLFAGIMDKYYRQREKDWTESKYVSRLKEMIAVERSLEAALKKYDTIIENIL
jgi:hypothetical protein